MIAEAACYALIVAGWTLFKARSLAANRKYKEAALYGGLMGLALVLGTLQIAKVELPSFVLPFRLLFEPIGRKLLSP